MNKLEENEPEPPTSQEDECVICINARATMQTSPCGHRVVCRRCFVKTIQSAVAQRLLPLRCVICRARVNRLTSGSDTWRIQESASNYSMGTSKSWSVSWSRCLLPSSNASINFPIFVFVITYRNRLPVHLLLPVYVLPNQQAYIQWVLGRRTFLVCLFLNHKIIHITQYGALHIYCFAHCAGVSNISSGSMSSGTSGTSSLNTKSSAESLTNHRNHEGCGSHCQGAIPRNTQYMQQSQFYNSNKRSAHHYTNKGRLNDMQNRLPPIKEFRSPTKVPIASSPAHINNNNNPRLR